MTVTWGFWGTAKTHVVVPGQDVNLEHVAAAIAAEKCGQMPVGLGAPGAEYQQEGSAGTPTMSSPCSQGGREYSVFDLSRELFEMTSREATFRKWDYDTGIYKLPTSTS